MLLFPQWCNISEAQSTYCKIEYLESLKTLLKTQGINLFIEKAESGQIGQNQNRKEHDLIKPKNSLIQQNKAVVV
jgi:hypothetical protein